MIESEVKRIVSEAYERAKLTLKQHEFELHVLAKALLERETLTGPQVSAPRAAILERGGPSPHPHLPPQIRSLLDWAKQAKDRGMTLAKMDLSSLKL